jgi:ABC-type dipeptide/oligopeptide/nickel transport system permease subunit
MKFVAKFSNPWFMSVSAIIATVVIGTIIGLILGIFLKRERPLM